MPKSEPESAPEPTPVSVLRACRNLFGRVVGAARHAPLRLGVCAVAVVATLLWLSIGSERNAGTRSGAPPVSAARPDTAAPRLASKISELNFGSMALGERSQKRFVLFHDGSGEGPLTIFNAWLSEPDALHFSTDFEGPMVLTAGESAILTVSFSPTRVGPLDAALYVSHDGASSIEIFGLSGTGTSSAALDVPRGMTRARPPATADVSMFQLRARPTFSKSVLDGLDGTKATSLQFGPDGRLYVADMFGVIRRMEVERQGANDYAVRSTETIKLVSDIPNHDDDGDPAPTVDKRLVTGLLVAGTASAPVIYVASSDPRIGGGHSHTDTNLDTNSGVISRLTLEGGQWTKLDLVRGLSRSAENHHTNGMALDTDTNTLYLAAGGNTNLGAPSNNFVKLPEYALSAAILSIDLGAIGDQTYDLPTLDDDSRPGSIDRNDPFGGNGGKNQAKLVPGGPVRVHAPGFRNAYDLVLTDDGRLYTVDNGGNAGWGGTPKGGNACTNAQSEPGKTFIDGLHFIDQPGYYGGHANPTRGNIGNTFNANGQSPVSISNPIECIHAGTGANGSLASYGASLNGLTEYRASNFGSSLQGDLLGVGFDNKVYRTILNAAGDDVVDNAPLFSNVGGLPLDVTAQADWQIFPGTIWVADFQKRNVVVFEPNDYDGSIIAACGSSPASDDDRDGYSNADEMANGTDPCSSADVPNDADGDRVSDLTDIDDDNDGLPDTADPFVLDASNGRGTTIPLDYDWENNSAPAGGLFNLGFTGLMNNGSSDWRTLFDPANLTASGAAGVFTIDAVPAGDVIEGANDQLYGFQFGIDVDPSMAPFVAHTRLVAPFAGASRKPHQSLGFFVGTGDQDNYIKLVANTKGPQGGVQFAAEREGDFENLFNGAASVYEADSVDLFLLVDPGELTVRAFHRTRRDGVDGRVIVAGGTTELPREWLTGDSGLAVGLISTSRGAEPFTATWDFLRIGSPDIVNLAMLESDGGIAGDGAGATTGGTAGATTSGTPDGTTGGTTGGGSGTVSSTAGAGGDLIHRADGAGHIVIEAEQPSRSTATSTHAWHSAALTGSSGGSMTTRDIGALFRDAAGSPSMGYALEVPAAGRWYVWVRGFGDQGADGEGKSDSVHVGLDGALSTGAAMVGFPARWAWSNSRRSTVRSWLDIPQAGVHELNVWMREDGLSIDRLLLTQDPDYRPAGVGPASSGTVRGSNADSDTDTDTDADADSNSNDGGTGDGVTGSGETVDGGNTAGDDVSDDTTASSATTGDTDGTTDDENASGTETAGEGGVSAGALDGVLLIEAEAGTTQSGSTHRWERWSDASAVGGLAMRNLPDNGKLQPGKEDSPHLGYSIELPSAGTWYVWVRGFGDTDPQGEGKNDSVHVGIDGVLGSAAAIHGFPPGWHWSRSVRGGSKAKVTVAGAGVHTLDVWMREDGFAFDRIALTQDPEWTPTGTGPASGSGTTGGGSTRGTSGGDGGTSGGADASVSDTTTGGTGGSTTGANTSSGSLQVARDSVVRIPADAYVGLRGAGAHRWEPQSSGALKALPDTGTLRGGQVSSPAVDYRVSFDRPGTWQVWVHGLGDADVNNNGRNDSVHVGLNGVLADAAAIHGFPPRWSWSSQTRGGGVATVQVAAAGEAELSVWMREDGFAFDALTLIGPGAPISSPEQDNGGTGGAGTTGESTMGDGSAGSGTSSGTAQAVRVPHSARWLKLSSSNGSEVVARHEGGGVAFEGKLYVLGGRGTRAVSIYDPASRQWRNGTPPPIEMHHFQPVVFGDSIWAIGAMTGRYPAELSVPDVYRYRPASDEWFKEGKIPAARLRGSMGAAVRGNLIYLVGGNTRGHDGGAVAWFDSFDPVTGQWTSLPPAPNARDHAPIGIVGDRLVAAAGRRSTRPNVFANMVAGVDVFDFSTGTWSSAAGIPTQRAGTMVVTVGSEVIVMGGESDRVAAARDSVEAFDTVDGSWRRLDGLFQGVHGGGAALLADGLHVASGNVTKGGGAESNTHQLLPFTP